MKKCSKCKLTKPTSEFNNSRNSKDGLKHWCRSCQRIDSKERRIRNGGKVHIDRSTETESTKICTKCKKLKSKEEYSNRQSWCKSCIKIYNRAYLNNKGIKKKFIPIITDTGKQCAKCRKIKDYDEFSPSKRGFNGKSSYCKPCNSLIQLEKVTKEERRINTQKYRNNNRSWWRFLHRINQHNRRAKIKSNSDGTVTKEFMISLYNTKRCYYCKRIIERDNRTCEHKHPISKGGIHGISNLVMACISCNSKKKDKTEEEFIKYLYNENTRYSCCGLY